MRQRSALRLRLLAPVFSALFLALIPAACQPTLPSPSPADGTAASPDTEPHALLEPDAPFDAAPRVLRVRIIPSGGGAVDAGRLLFVRGHVGPAHVRQVEHDDVSKALSERIVPALSWEEDGPAVIAPLVALEPGQTYGVLSGDPPLGLDIQVAPSDDIPLLSRVWPPVDAPDTGPFGILCGAAALAPAPASLDLDPGQIQAIPQIGAAAHLPPTCLRIDVDTPALDSAASTATSDDPLSVLAPPLLDLADGSQVRLDPQPISLATSSSPAAPPPFEPLACTGGDVPFGPGCAHVEDDRLRISSPDAALLWSVRVGATGQVLRATAPSEPWVITGLDPATLTSFDVATIDVSGAVRASSPAVLTTSPMPHVVLSEVLANPLGAEPDQEWVELYNDGLAGADLTGYVLADIGGETALPPAVLPSGVFALVVNETFVEDDELDPVPAEGTLLLRVPKLGKGGLKNDGEPLKLLAPDGTVLSRFPASPKPKPGQSVARTDESAPDGDSASFAAATPTPGAPN